MTVNALSPAFVKLYYTGVSGSHVMTFGMLPDPLTPIVVGSPPNIVLKNGSVGSWTASVTSLVALLHPLMYTASEIQYAEFWSQPLPTDDPLWVDTVPIGQAGSGGATTNPASQLTISFRTTLGGIMKLVVLDTNQVPATINTYPFGAGAITNLANHVTGGTSALIGRDNGKPAIAIRALGKVNDALRKRHYNL